MSRLKQNKYLTCGILCIVALATRTTEAAKILAVFPTPSISHQVVFRPITQELVRRGHNVVVVTTDPAFSKDEAPANLTEIDVHDLSYDIWVKAFLEEKPQDNFETIHLIFDLVNKIFEKQIKSEQVQRMIKLENHFDLILVEELIRPALIFSHIYKVPTISINSFGYVMNDCVSVGAPEHTLLYPSVIQEKIIDLTIWDKIKNLQTEFKIKSMHNDFLQIEHDILKRNFGNDVPSILELKNNVDLVLLNQYAVWDFNRPVPPNVINIGGIYKKPINILPQDLNKFINASVNGVIYFSLGTNFSPSTLPYEKIQIMMKVFSKLTMDILWKYDKDELPDKPKNVRIGKWFPQSDLLRHPKVKLFITHGGLQSTNEAISSSVPMLGIPVFGDQLYNAEMYKKFKIGKRLDWDQITEESFYDAIVEILRDDSYRQNIKKLYATMTDEPMPPLERAVWWIEHVLRHGGGKHLRSAAAGVTWWEYYEISLVFLLLGTLVLIIASLLLILHILYRFVCSLKGSQKVKRR